MTTAELVKALAKTFGIRPTDDEYIDTVECRQCRGFVWDVDTIDGLCPTCFEIYEERFGAWGQCADCLDRPGEYGEGSYRFVGGADDDGRKRCLHHGADRLAEIAWSEWINR